MNPDPENLRNRTHPEDDWVQVAELLGASLIGMTVEYLRANGLHPIVIESSALGLVTGHDAIAKILVREQEVGQAMDLLEPQETAPNEGGETGEEPEFESELPEIEKAVLGASALVFGATAGGLLFSTVGAGVAYALSVFAEVEETEEGLLEAECPVCGTVVELDDKEAEQRWFACPECGEIITLEDFFVCPSCKCEVELDEKERAQGWFICPDCRRAVRIKDAITGTD